MRVPVRDGREGWGGGWGGRHRTALSMKSEIHLLSASLAFPFFAFILLV